MLDTAWVALSLSGQIGSKRLRALVAHFGDTRAVLTADDEALRAVPGIGPKIARTIQSINLSEVEQTIPHWQAAGVTLATLHDPAYPASLRQLEDAPATLFLRGVWRQSSSRAVAIVGTREPSMQSVEVAQRLSYELARCGFIIVSGLAVGVDTAAHIGALAASNGYTLAVLGSGVLSVYPEQNRALAQAIVRRGVLLSEVHPWSAPSAATLVARNRIISGLCDTLVVIETEPDGGAMHAAKRAREQGRRVSALDNDATGNRQLIAEGAVPLCADLSGWEATFL